MNNEFDYIRFIKDFTSCPNEQKLAMVGTPIANQSGSYIADCMELGMKIVQESFNLTDDEEFTLLMHTMAGAIATIQAVDASIESQAMLAMATNSDTIKKLCQLVFYCAVGLSVKEEIR